MGKELEYKLFVPSEAALREILQDADIADLTDGSWREMPMKTTYYDSSDRRFGRRNWTLRRRMEGGTSVVCVKTPDKASHTRGEWQVCADRLDDAAMEALLLAGAPQELLLLYGAGDIFPVCGAEFTRNCVMLQFPDGSRAELAGDCGILHGQTERLPFTELELELYGGEPTEMLSLVSLLCKRYGLTEQPKSKFARARSLK
ncbi:MAG: inorganic triphosphatase [Faecousia sp.]